jgi:GNAT superfamily N-acetyltransferase
MIPSYRATYNQLSRRLLSKRARVYHYTWGVLSINSDNPGHYDANTATWEDVPDPERALAEVERVYREFNITPRIRLTEYSKPNTLATFLESRQYVNYFGHEQESRIMRWSHTPIDVPVVPPSVQIRRATPDDVHTVVRVIFEAENLVDDWSRNYVTYGLYDPRITYFMALVDTQPAAVVALGQTKTLGMIDDVATLPAYRGQGLARYLLQTAQHHAATDLMLEVVEANAQRIYERAGFAVEGTIRESRWVPC